ncbi:hypothetical protein [Clostridium estertheticum]|uniref:Uncharacterized protein n=1 Tax=Clostridium estertheticum TaxID=238834 RepID=A0AA47EEP7_9CLOT|nr:hypothetical protein [Clostridium estertheticum]MBU3155009.1 hypothetical protein [Clostridium estertheticum]WAG58827.1 hypothetical protein LL038_14315 [Clostridium estertheticum]
MNEVSKEVILNSANRKIIELQKIFSLSFEKITVELDEESEIGSGYFKPEFKEKIFLVTKYFEDEDKNVLNKIASEKVAHEFCHLYVNDMGYIAGGAFNKDIERELLRLIDTIEIMTIRDDLKKYDITKLISEYAYKNSSINEWHEVLCESFSRYFCYDYIKNEENLIREAYTVHKGLVDFLISYKIRDNYFIDELDLEYSGF